MAKQRKASIVENEADATHILHPTTDPDGEMFCRGVFKRGLQCLVHFYRMPESHDNWGQVRKDTFYYFLKHSIIDTFILCTQFDHGRW